MRTILFVLAMCLGSGAADAASPLQGQWNVTVHGDPTFSGVVLIDAQGRVTWDAVWDRQYRIKTGSTEVGDGKAKWRGYMRAGYPRIELVLTNGSKVDRLFCTAQSSDLLHCYSFLSDGQPSAVTVLARVGPGPANLLTLN